MRGALNVLVAASALTLIALPARAQEVGEGTSREETEKVDRGSRAKDEEPSYPVPRVRLELNFRTSFLVSSKMKIGEAGNAHTINPRRDLHLPATPSLGLRALAEIKFHENFLVGGYYTHNFIRADERGIHQSGVSLGDGRLSRDARVKTSIDISMAEVFLRFVGKDNASVKFSFGIGVAWTRLKIRLEAEDRGVHSDTDEHVDGFFVPTIGYMIQFKVVSWLDLFLESMNGLINPTNFPSITSEFRLGARITFGGFELLLAATSYSGQIENLDDLWGGKAATSTHEWRQASWWLVGGEFGVSWRF